MDPGTNFLDKVLTDFRDGSFYLSFNIESPEIYGEVIIENTDFYYYLNQKEGIGKDAYQTFVRGLLQENRVILIDTNLSDWGFTPVVPVVRIESYSKLGVDNFIYQFFEGNVLKDGITDDERPAILNQLFKWKIASNIDDETGFMVISR